MSKADGFGSSLPGGMDLVVLGLVAGAGGVRPAHHRPMRLA